MNRNYELTLIKNTILDENGREIASYGITYADKDHTITVRHLSTKRSDVEFFIAALSRSSGSLSLIDDLLEDFVS